MISSRNRNVVIKSQFNIHGSRGKSVGGFITDYVARSSATDMSMAYDRRLYKEPGDGVSFTTSDTAISRAETLRIADHVEELFQQGDRAIQELVISFDHDFLVEQNIVSPDVVIENRGDYEGQYDDIRLRHALREGLQDLIDLEGYRDGRAVAAIQHDTTHLHVHAVVYEDSDYLSRMRGKEEKGVIKQSSFNHMADSIERSLSRTKGQEVVCEDTLTIHQKPQEDTFDMQVPLDFSQLEWYLARIEEEEEEEVVIKEKELIVNKSQPEDVLSL